jgi:hypothetical protein
MKLNNIKSKNELKDINERQNYLSFCVNDFSKYFNRLANSLGNGDIDLKDGKKIITNSYKEMKKVLENFKDLSDCDFDSANNFLDSLRNSIELNLIEKKKELKRTLKKGINNGKK